MAQPIGDVKQALRRMQNGSRIHRLTIGVLPDVLRRQLAVARRYRRELEQIVLDAKGQVSLVDAHWIDQAASAEVHAAVCRMLMRQRWDTMTATDVVTCSKEIMKSKATRNAAIEKLGLDRVQENVIDCLYRHHDDDLSHTFPPVAMQGDDALETPSDDADATQANVDSLREESEK